MKPQPNDNAQVEVINAIKAYTEELEGLLKDAETSDSQPPPR